MIFQVYSFIQSNFIQKKVGRTQRMVKDIQKRHFYYTEVKPIIYPASYFFLTIVFNPRLTRGGGEVARPWEGEFSLRALQSSPVPLPRRVLGELFKIDFHESVEFTVEER